MLAASGFDDIVMSIGRRLRKLVLRSLGGKDTGNGQQGSRQQKLAHGTSETNSYADHGTWRASPEKAEKEVGRSGSREASLETLTKGVFEVADSGDGLKHFRIDDPATAA
jgi:hypothetical protein